MNSNRDKLYLIDLDHTLFNTELFVKELPAITEPDLSKFLYPDAIAFVNYVKKYGKPVLFSEGEIDFQKLKITRSGLEAVFDGNVKIFESYTKLNNFDSNFDSANVVLIDDKPEVTDFARKKNIKVIRLRRGKYKQSESEFKPDFEVDSLEEIIRKDILSRL